MEMATGPAIFHDNISLFHFISNLSNFIIMDWIQGFLVFLSGICALLFLFRKFFFKSKLASKKGCDDNCNCH